MSFVSNTVLAFSMSADAFAAAIAKGSAVRKTKITEALRIGVLFGIIEAIMPIIGWSIGLIASKFIIAIDHWVAFTILGIIGLKMIWEGFNPDEEAQMREKKRYKLHILALTAVGTSIDAMAVGVTLAFVNANIWITSAMIGAATFIMVTIGIMAGRYIGAKAGRIAEILGGICLIVIGTKILCEHLGYL